MRAVRVVRRLSIPLAAAAMPIATPALPDDGVVACDTLVALRIVGAGPDAARRPGCRLVPRSDIGAVERRAMVGGAPFECLVVRGSERCLWVLP